MASSDVTVAQNGHFKHPYLLALVRWLVSSFWSSATLLLHRLVTAPLPPVTVFPSSRWKPRPASSGHLHPEPLVECVVLHTPEQPTLDVIFVHGLYGSLGNTWRQGEWRARYNIDPVKVPLRRPHSVPSCKCVDDTDKCNEQILDTIEQNSDDEVMVREVGENIYRNIRKILPNDNIFITEKFYNNTLLDQVEIVSNYETQAQFVRDLFESDNEVKVDSKVEKEESFICDVKRDEQLHCQCAIEADYEDEARGQVDRDNEVNCNRKAKCDAGCGCVCDDCYSPCWPRDWIKVDYPGARIISINYTSDPHLWRPLWVKQSKRLQLHERAEQMMDQLLALGVGDRPIIWVGHSKGGLFIKQMYCEAYEAYLKMKLSPEEAENIKNEQTAKLNYCEQVTDDNVIICNDCDNTSTGCYRVRINNYSNNDNNDNDNELIMKYVNNEVMNNKRLNNINTNNLYIGHIDNSDPNDNYKILFNETDETLSIDDRSVIRCNDDENLTNIPVFRACSSNDQEELEKRSRLWLRSAGFMFYSVPHRGSSLADIKTPITARSIELMEICKDCELVLSLQERWARASVTSRPKVRSLVETCKTLMSVLWLRIVSVDSADPGIGSLYGVNVDHREICKPSSRSCLLYQELMALMSSALKNKSSDCKAVTE